MLCTVSDQILIMCGKSRRAAWSLRRTLSVLALLCALSLGGGSDSVEKGGGSSLQRRGSSVLGLAIVSPLPGEWINHKAFSVVVEVWSLRRADFELKLWLNDEEVYNRTAAHDADWAPWALRHIPSYRARSSSWPIINSSAADPSSQSSFTSPAQYVTESRIHLLLPDIPSSPWSMTVCAHVSMPGSTTGHVPENAHAQSTAKLFSSWGGALSTLRGNPYLAMMLVTRVRRSPANGVWPPSALVLQWPTEGSCVNPSGFEASFALLEGGGDEGEEGDGAVAVVARLDGEVLERLSPWARSVYVGGMPLGPLGAGGGFAGGKHCLTLSHETGVEGAIVAAPVGACFTTSCGDGREGSSSRDPFLEEEAKGRVLLATWMPPRHHTTGMAERLWQVVSRLVESGMQVLIASYACSAKDLHPPAKQYGDPRIRIVSCGFELTPTEVSSILLRYPVEHVIVASWWFQHPRTRGLPEVWIPEVREYAESASLSILVDDLFEPELGEIRRELKESESNLAGVCGAQILAFAGADAIGTLTEEDAEVLAAYLPPDGVPITRVRYTTSSRDQPALPARARRSSGSGSSEGGVGGGRLVYVGSCHEANTAALAWLIEDVLPHLGRLLVGGGAWQLRVVGDVTMCDLWRGACKEEDCKAGRAGEIIVEFLGYVEDLPGEIQSSTVYLSPRLAGLGLSTKLMLGLENGVPSVTTPHGIRGYNITAHDGTQGVLVAPPGDPRLFAEQVHRLIVDRELWRVASRGGPKHVAEHFSTDMQREDVMRLLEAAKEHRGRAM